MLKGMKFSSRYLGEAGMKQLPETAPVLDVPVIFVNGRDDHVTPTVMVEQYFNILKAPESNYLSLSACSQPVVRRSTDSTG